MLRDLIHICAELIKFENQSEFPIKTTKNFFLQFPEQPTAVRSTWNNLCKQKRKFHAELRLVSFAAL